MFTNKISNSKTYTKGGERERERRRETERMREREWERQKGWKREAKSNNVFEQGQHKQNLLTL